MNSSSQVSTGVTAAISAATSAPTPSRPSRLETFFALFARHAGAIAIDHTHMLPLDRVSGRTGNIAPTITRRRCC